MKILYSPQVNLNEKIIYDFGNDVVTVKIGEKIDIFDFTEFTDGELTNIETSLKYSPILSARKENGELLLELLNFIDDDATEDEKFPKWQEV